MILSKSSIEHAIEVCEKFDIKYEIISIEPMVSGFIKNMDEAQKILDNEKINELNKG